MNGLVPSSGFPWAEAIEGPRTGELKKLGERSTVICFRDLNRKAGLETRGMERVRKEVAALEWTLECRVSELMPFHSLVLRSPREE